MAERRYFGNIEEVIEPPNLIEVQSKSYEDFLQKHIAPSQRTETGLQVRLQHHRLFVATNEVAFRRFADDS